MVLVIFAAVALQIISAVVLKGMADHPLLPALFVALGIVLVAALNAARFLAWGYAHRRYPLSHSYPLSSMFFPLMLGVAWLYGDPISANQVAGTVLITAGVAWVAFRVRT
ncbi:MAG: hypothetical protein ACE5FN_03315 [Leptospirillia bacterium]